MARDLLAHLVGHRHRFRATVGRTGEDDKGRRTILLVDLLWQGGAWVCDHLWLPLSAELRPLCNHLGRSVSFTATVRPYRRLDRTTDYEVAGIGDVVVRRR